MHKLFFILALALAACENTADTTESPTGSVPGIEVTSLPVGFTVVEQSSDGYFIRLASAERASFGTIRKLADYLSGSFDRIDLCLDGAHERGDEYIAIIDGKVFDYENNSIYSIE